MAVAITVPGACLVKTGTGLSDALEELGYSIDGVEIQQRSFQLGVPSDSNGGTDGPPVAKQYFGQIHIVSLEMSRYDDAVLQKIETIVNDNGTTAAGAIATPGTLIDPTASNLYRLVLASTNLSRNYLGAIPIDIFNIRSSKFSRPRVVFECHAVSGVLWNTTLT